jgi:hypothetical protein
MTALLDQAERLTSPAPLEIAEAVQLVVRRAVT